jgi:opacity protein-like surface antigen
MKGATVRALVGLAASLFVLSAGRAAFAADESEASGDESSDKAEESKSAPSEAETKKADAKEESEGDKEDTFGHRQQFSVRLGVMFGYKMDFRYPHSPYCAESYNPAKGGDEQLKTCGWGAMPALDVALGFAIIDSVEPFLFGRFGFGQESRTNTNAQVMIGAGARLYTMSDSRFKIFFEPALAYEFEDGAPNTAAFNPTGFPLDYKKDLVFHLGIGPQYDFAKNVGMYLNSGLDVGVLRSISAVLLLNIGVQARFP